MAFSDEDIKKESGSNDEFLGKLENWHTSAKDFRRKLDWRWFIAESFVQGDHYVYYNTRTNQLERISQRNNVIRLVLNKCYEIERAIVNFATTYRPKWEVLAESSDEDVVNNARKNEKLLDNDYDDLQIKKKQKQVTRSAVRRGVGFFKYGWDDVLGKPFVDALDSFDVFLDPYGILNNDIQQCRYIDICMQVPVQDIRDNPHYKGFDDKTGDDKRAASEIKEILQDHSFTNSAIGLNDELSTKLLHETYFKKKVKDNIEVWVASWVDGKLLRNEKTEFEKYPIISSSADDGIYGEGFIKNIIPLNKVLNKLSSIIMQYNILMNKGRYIADKGSGFEKLTNETGEIILKNKGFDVHESSPQGLAPIINDQISMILQMIKDISGVQDAFLGKNSSNQSGVALESMKSQTANNLQGLRENQEETLEELGEALLKLYYNHQLTPKTVKSSNESGSADYFKMVSGAVYGEGQQPSQGTYTVGEENQIRVTIGSGLAYTREGKQIVLDKLYDKKLIDRMTYLKQLEFGGSIESIVKAVEEEERRMAEIEQMKNNPQAPKDFTGLVEEENQMMAMGQSVPPTPMAPKQHTDLHVKFSQTSKVSNNEQVLKILLNHIKGEERARMGIKGE